MKKIFENLTAKDGVINKITGVVGQAVTDKDKLNAIVAQITAILMQSKVAPYIRGALALVTVIGCLFFADKMTIEADTQQYLLYAIYGFYFLDFMRSSFGGGKK